MLTSFNSANGRFVPLYTFGQACHPKKDALACILLNAARLYELMATKHDREPSWPDSEKRRLTLYEAYSFMRTGSSFENQALYQATSFRNTYAV